MQKVSDMTNLNSCNKEMSFTAALQWNRTN